MTDLQAAIGLVQLGRLDEIVARRREIAAGYAKAIAELSGLRMVADPPGGPRIFNPAGSRSAQTMVGIGTACSPLSRTRISPRGAGSWRPTGNRPLRTGTPAVSATGHGHLTDNTLILPLYHQMSESEQARVIDVLRAVGAIFR